MLIKPIIKEALQSLWGTKQRSILALIGIVIGGASVIAMVSVGIIVREEAMRQFLELGADILHISKSYSGNGKKPSPDIEMEDALDIPDQCPEVARVAPYTSTYGIMQCSGKEFWVSAISVTDNFLV